MTAATPTGRRGYSRLAIALHWVIALMILGNLVGGLVAHEMLEAATGADRAQGLRLMELHKSAGLTILGLSLVRLATRLLAGVPALPVHMTATERALARIVHGGFYVLMLALPLAGWVMVSASPSAAPLSWFGLVSWPLLPVPVSAGLGEAAAEAHELLALGMLALLALHVAGALKHHVLDRDEVLARMLPLARRRELP
ncbi:cytochrome b [Thermaurantiacus sp.]